MFESVRERCDLRGGAGLLPGMLAAWVIAGSMSLASSASAAADGRPELAWFVENCDRIVRGEVVAIRELALEQRLPPIPPATEPTARIRNVRVLDIRIDDVVWGPPELEHVAVFDEPKASFLDAGAPVVVGDRAYWIVERALHPWMEDSAGLDALTHAAGTRELEQTLSNGAGRLRIEGGALDATVCLPATLFRMPALPIVARHETAKPKRAWADVPIAEFDAWLRSTVRALVPSVRAEHRWTAPTEQPHVFIGSDGAADVVSDGHDRASEAMFGPDVLARIAETAREQRFLELPPWVGHSRGTCSGGLRLRIRLEQGSRVVWISGGADLRRDGPAELDALTRARSVLDAIPVAREWRYGD